MSQAKLTATSRPWSVSNFFTLLRFKSEFGFRCSCACRYIFSATQLHAHFAAY